MRKKKNVHGNDVINYYICNNPVINYLQVDFLHTSCNMYKCVKMYILPHQRRRLNTKLPNKI